MKHPPIYVAYLFIEVWYGFRVLHCDTGNDPKMRAMHEKVSYCYSVKKLSALFRQTRANLARAQQQKIGPVELMWPAAARNGRQVPHASAFEVNSSHDTSLQLLLQSLPQHESSQQASDGEISEA